MTRTHTIIDSPIGELTLVGRDEALVGVYMEGQRHRPDPSTFGPRVSSGLREASEQLEEYFSGERTEFDLRLDPPGNGFQRRVWARLTRIPYGETRSYTQLAEELGDLTAIRAVAAANGRNPISVIVPCHRVVGSDGSLVGYAGGLDRKRFLLDLETPAERRAVQLSLEIGSHVTGRGGVYTV